MSSYKEVSGKGVKVMAFMRHSLCNLSKLTRASVMAPQFTKVSSLEFCFLSKARISLDKTWVCTVLQVGGFC